MGCEQTERAFLRAHSRRRCVKDCVRKARTYTYLDSHVLEAVPCVLHYFAKSEYGAEGVCFSVINARLEVGSGDVGKDIPPKVGRKHKIGARTTSKKSHKFPQDTGEFLAATYLLKLNLGYQMLFLIKRVKFSAAFKKAGLKKITTYC